MLRDPPLVEIPMATSSGLRLRDQLAQKDYFDSNVVGDRGDVRGLQGERYSGHRAITGGGGKTQSMAKSLASVAEPPFPKMISLPPL